MREVEITINKIKIKSREVITEEMLFREKNCAVCRCCILSGKRNIRKSNTCITKFN